MSPRPASPTAPIVLVYGSDEVLLGTRAWVLEGAGYLVNAVLKVDEVARFLQSGDISLLVLCHSLSAEECEAALKLAESRDPAIRTLVLTAGYTPCAEHSDDSVLDVRDGPRRLVGTVERLLKTTSLSN